MHTSIYKSLSFFLSFAFVAAALAPISGSAAGLVVERPVVLKLSAGHSVEELAMAEVYDLKQVFAQSSDSELSRVYKGSFAGSLDVLMQAPAVESAGYDKLVSNQDIYLTDPSFTTDQSDPDKQWWLSRVRVPEAWEVERGSSDVAVAIVDTGVNGLHEDLNDGRVGAGYIDYCQVLSGVTGRCLVEISGTVQGSVNSDDNGHGTIVAGIIGAIPNNSRGIAGINWKVRIIPVKALDKNGTGLSSHVAAGIVWATDNGADIINLSLGGTSLEGNLVLNEAISYAYKAGVLLVAAAGNDSSLIGADLDIEPVYPICSDNGANMILGVTATDINDRKASFSNFGRGCIDVSSPGTTYFNSNQDQKGIISTYYDPLQPNKNGLYVFASGTSMAAPVVSGIAALLKSAHPDLAAASLRDRLVGAADDIDGLNQNSCKGLSCTGRLGSGRINAYKAVLSRDFSQESLVRDTDGQIYLIENGLLRSVSDYVFQQREFNASKVSNVAHTELESYPRGAAVPPIDGSLLKSPSAPTVYYVEDGVLEPMSYLAFRSFGFDFSAVVTLPEQEMNSYRLGRNLLPANGALLKLRGQPAVYFMHEGQRRLISYTAFRSRQLDFADVVEVEQNEFDRYPQDVSTPLQPPLDGTLIKGDSLPTVYVIESGRRRALSAASFAARGYSFGSVLVVPQSEIEQYASGTPIN